MSADNLQSPDITEQKYVVDVYNKIAYHFDKTRIQIWKSVDEFIKSIKPNSLVIDVGAGNGKNAELRKDCKFVCTDISQEMVNICLKKGLEATVADVTKMPYQDNTFDYVICIAVIHHLSTVERRQQAIKELMRIVKPNGKIFVQVWAYESFNKSKKEGGSGKINNDSQDQMIRWTLHKKFNNENSDKKQDEQIYRYYHFFKQGELDSLFDGFIIESSFVDHTNYCLIAGKK